MLLGNRVCNGWTYSVQQVLRTSLGGFGLQTNYSIWPWILYVVLKIIKGLKVVGILLHFVQITLWSHWHWDRNMLSCLRIAEPISQHCVISWLLTTVQSLLYWCGIIRISDYLNLWALAPNTTLNMILSVGDTILWFTNSIEQDN